MENYKAEGNYTHEEIVRFNEVSSKRHLKLNVLTRDCFGTSEPTDKDGQKKNRPAQRKRRSGPLPLLLMLISTVIGIVSCDRLYKVLKCNFSPTYTWTYEGQTYTANFHFSEEQYEFYARKSLQPNLACYATQEPTERYLEYVSQELYKNIKDKEYSNQEVAEYLLAFVQQCIGSSKEARPAYPLETLVKGRGDCKAKSILYASLLETFNISCLLITLPNHVAVAVDYPTQKKPYCLFHGRNFYYAETTDLWSLGDIPEDVKNVSEEHLYRPEQTTSFTLARPLPHPEHYKIDKEEREGEHPKYSKTYDEYHQQQPHPPNGMRREQ